MSNRRSAEPDFLLHIMIVLILQSKIIFYTFTYATKITELYFISRGFVLQQTYLALLKKCFQIKLIYDEFVSQKLSRLAWGYCQFQKSPK